MVLGNSDENDNIDYGWSLDRDFIDKLLLALIDAHPEPQQAGISSVRSTKRRRDRLREARLALFPGLNAPGRPLDPDNHILSWMGREHYRDIARTNMGPSAVSRTKIRSDRQLAIEAHKRFGEPRSSTERLREKFGKQRERWLDAALYHDDVPEQLDYNLLQQIADLLSKRRIDMKLDRVSR